MRTFEDDAMNRKSRQIKDAGTRPAWKLAAVISIAAAIAACDGANQGVQIGTGQNPGGGDGECCVVSRFPFLLSINSLFIHLFILSSLYLCL